MSHFLAEVSCVEYPELLTCKRTISHLFERVCSLTQLKPLGDLVMHEFEKDEINGFEPGLTAFQILAESHISYHSYVEERGFALDIYSCHDFDVDSVRQLITDVFGDQIRSSRVVSRELPPPPECETNAQPLPLGEE